MNHPFIEGETYWNPDYQDDIFVLAICEMPEQNEVILAVLHIDIHTKANKGADDIVVKSPNFSKWKRRELV